MVTAQKVLLQVPLDADTYRVVYEVAHGAGCSASDIVGKLVRIAAAKYRQANVAERMIAAQLLKVQA